MESLVLALFVCLVLALITKYLSCLLYTSDAADE